MTDPRDDWPRLAVYVASARQDAGFSTVRSFADALGITERTLGNLERGRRVSRETLLTVARAVGWTPDSPRKILAGGEPVTLAGEPAPVARRAAPPAPGEDALRQIMEDERLPLELRRAMVALARLMRQATDAGNADADSA
jgi:transcriptional regulator with XRE-family HTH domain